MVKWPRSAFSCLSPAFAHPGWPLLLIRAL
uniref:Uncharacterized protein n=1 Tax=Anguilla anguilla TaxID=7936 RepID=A0A0E9S3U8_ANGAN